VGVVLFSILSTGFFVVRMTLLEFAVLAVATVLAFIPFAATILAAVVIFALVYLWQRRRAGALPAPTTAATVQPR
jgi:hypothetical protein